MEMKMKMKFFTTIIFLLTLLFATVSHAGVIPPTLNGQAESGDELWTFTDSSNVFDDAGFEMTFSSGEFWWDQHEFGFYQYDTATNSIASMLAIFGRADDVGANTSVIWNLGLNRAASKYGIMDLSLASDLAFGFYFKGGGETFYSQSALNGGGEDHFGFYWDPDLFSTTDLTIHATDNSRWFSDAITVEMNDVQRFQSTSVDVPEPMSLALFGLALIGLAVSRKRVPAKID